jgi:hypothetical protein
MNRNLIIAAVVLVMLGAGLYIYQKSQNGQMDPASMMKDDASALGKINGTLQDLFAKGVPMQCSFTSTAEGSATSGTVYVSGQNMRGEFASTQAGENEVMSYMIRTGDTTYTWSSNQQQGVKMTFSEEDAAEMQAKAEAMQKENPQAFSENQSMDYDCKPWVPTLGSFTPPTDIEFMDLSAQMQQMQQKMEALPTGSDTMEDSQCAMCMQVPAGDAREQCKKALNCQ